MPVDYKVIGSRIKSSRKEKNITQEKMAKKIGVSIAYLSRVERGNSQINLKRLTQISDEIGVPISYLLSGSIEESSDYLGKDFQRILKKCTPEKQRLIYEVATLIMKM